MEEKEVQKKAESYFKSSPSLTSITGTSDGHFFYKEFDAKKYCFRNKGAKYYVVLKEVKEVKKSTKKTTK